MTRLRRGIPALFCLGWLAGNAWAQTTAPAIRNYARLPLSFEKHGERFVARGQGYLVGVEAGKLAIGIEAAGRTTRGVSVEFTGARRSSAVPGPELPGKVNYYLGNDPKKWQIGLPTYAGVTYPDAYPGIDVVYYGNQQQIEFDLVVKPGADPEAVRLKVGGGGRLSVDDSGALLLGEAGGLKVALPEVYQQVNGVKRSVPGHYAITGPDEVAFKIDPWDRTLPLVIDPTIVYSTTFGGGLGPNYGLAIALDSLGDIILSGYTYAADFPTLNPYQNHFAGIENAFVTKLDPAGTTLIYSTFLGGSQEDYAYGVAADSANAAWVTGFTRSSDFPVVNAAQSAFGAGPNDAFVARLDASGVLQFSTFLGSNTKGSGIAAEGTNGYVTGSNSDASFPTTGGVIQPTSAGGAAFVTKYTSSGLVVYSTLLGGTQTHGQAIAVDSQGNAYVTGQSSDTSFTGMPPGGAQPVNKGDGDAFIAKLNSTATAISYFTFLGGTGLDQGQAIAVDSRFNAYVAGYTSSAGLATEGAAQTALKGATNGFAAELNPSGTEFTWITYLGGNHDDYLDGMALDGSGNLYLTGYTDSDGFPTVAPVQAAMPGNGASLFNSTNSGASWSAFDSNIPGIVAEMSIHPSGRSAVVLTESGIYRTVNGGASWTQQSTATFGSDGVYAVAISRSPVAPGTIYAMQGNTIYQSVDDGVTWTNRGGQNVELAGILADPLTADGVYSFGYQLPYNYAPYVSISTNGGATWSPAGTSPPEGFVSMVATTDGALYGDTGAGVYKSTNRGASWAAASTGLPTGYMQAQQSLSASGTTVYYAQGFSVYATANGGASWKATGEIQASSIVASPTNASILYALTFSGKVQASVDGGMTWSAPGIGLPPGTFPQASQLVIDPSDTARVLVTTATLNEAGFVAKVSGTGSTLSWSSYLGGASAATAYGVATDSRGDAFVTGTASGGFPITSSALPTNAIATLPPGSYSQAAFLIEISDSTATCSTSVDPGSLLASKFGGTYSFTVVAPSGCPWSAMSDESWATVVGGASGTGTGVVTVLITANSGTAARNAILTVGSLTVNITQPSSSCLYSLDMFVYYAAAGAGTVSAFLTATAGCPWAVTNPYSSAITITSNASGTGSAEIVMALTPNLTSRPLIYSLPVGTALILVSQSQGGSTAQTITFPPLNNVTYGVPPFTIAAGASSDLTVVFSSTTPGVCTVNGTTVTIGGGGVCIIEANQGGSFTYAPAATVVRTFTVRQAAQTITFPALSNQLLNTAAPLQLGASATSGSPVAYVSNSSKVCTVSGVYVTLHEAGTCSITASQPGNSDYLAAIPVNRTFLVSAGPPAILSISPSSGAGTSVTFKAVYADPNGAADLNEILLQINATQSAVSACYVYYQPQGNHLYLANNAGAWITPALTPGVAGTAANSQCTLNAGTSSVVLAGNDLTLSVALTFSGTVAGSPNVYLYADGLSGQTSGWIKEGTWTPNPFAGPPGIVGLTPSGGTGQSVTFKAVYADPNGAGDLNEILLQVNAIQSSANACYVYYQPQGNHLYLATNLGVWITRALTPGVAGTASSSQCTLNAGTSSVTTAGNELILNAALTFSSTVLGSPNVYLYAGGFSGQNSGWVREGSWTPNGSAGPPSVVSLAPSSATGTSVTFQAVVADPNGATDLSELLLQINATQSGANACFIYYQPEGNHLYLANNGGAWITPALTPGVAAAAANSQCTLNAGTSSVTTKGNDLTLNVSVTFSGTFVGARNVYLYAYGLSGQSTGWVKEGTWAP